MHFCRYYREDSHCEKCDQSCERCTGPGPDSCRACSPPLLELQGTKLCVERCPHRFYQLNDICKQCHTSCQTCTGTDGGALNYTSIISDFSIVLSRPHMANVLSTCQYWTFTFTQLLILWVCMCVCRCLASGMYDVRLGQHLKGQSLLSTLWGGAILLRKGVLLATSCALYCFHYYNHVFLSGFFILVCTSVHQSGCSNIWWGLLLLQTNQIKWNHNHTFLIKQICFEC